ncbi:hypothetical protein [Roseimaritima ulvae]|uniref:Peptidase MA-like domain-containing protein n=1 Tax=Roseimaritima ulvae TaxID=980254 RepID=A0A5B9QQ88_9BACT|nr:hypothetical protein [Roseimaritima ulvae]QEG39820.1 hypothetical protein UC8_18190 [Roseimaritima ulvae]
MDATNQLRTGVSTVLSTLIWLAAVGVGLLGASPAAYGQASVRTQNFIISAPNPQLAQAVGKAAEKYRSELADYWLGYELSPWQSPCPIRVVSGPQLAAQGVTHYDIQPVRNFRMEVVGTPERILDSVLPHEVTHTILATHFGRPLPRWADEGVCTIVEHEAEKSKHEAHLRNFLRTERGIAMNKLFLLREYPDDIHPMYAQGYSVCRFLIEQQGPRTFIQFLEKYIERPSWTDTVREHYGYDSLAELQHYWLKWVSDGSGAVEQYVKHRPSDSPSNIRLAAAGGAAPGVAPRPTPQIPAASQPTRSVDGPATLAASSDDSWYLRRRDQAAGQNPAATAAVQPAAAQSAAPPTTPRHVVAQPQGEQRMAPSPVWPVPARATKWR